MKLNKEEFKIENKSCIGYFSESSKYLLIQAVDENDIEVLDKEVEEISKQTDEKFSIIAFKIKDWNHELSPWKAPAIFGKENFGDGAKETLFFIENTLLPQIYKDYLIDDSIPIILGGYSLAALFSLWSSYQTKKFKAIVAASPSVWFNGWLEYAKDYKPKVDTIYLSLGDKEEKTKNKTMKTVGDNIRIQNEILKKQGIQSVLEWNEGNHFQNSELRLAKGFVWCMQILKIKKENSKNNGKFSNK